MIHDVTFSTILVISLTVCVYIYICFWQGHVRNCGNTKSISQFHISAMFDSCEQQLEWLVPFLGQERYRSLTTIKKPIRSDKSPKRKEVEDMHQIPGRQQPACHRSALGHKYLNDWMISTNYITYTYTYAHYI